MYKALVDLTLCAVLGGSNCQCFWQELTLQLKSITHLNQLRVPKCTQPRGKLESRGRGQELAKRQCGTCLWGLRAPVFRMECISRQAKGTNVTHHPRPREHRERTLMEGIWLARPSLTKEMRRGRGDTKLSPTVTGAFFFFSEPTIPPGPRHKLLFSITTCVFLPMQLIDVKLLLQRYK